MEILSSSSLGPMDHCGLLTESSQNADSVTGSFVKYTSRTGNDNSKPVHLVISVLCVK